jgi:hypothetical protein
MAQSQEYTAKSIEPVTVSSDVQARLEHVRAVGPR